MKQNWKKYGLIYRPSKKKEWQQSHAALPTVLHLHENIYRVYFTSRDKEQRTYVGYFEMDLTKISEPKIIKQSETPVLSPGRIGCFDFDGVQCTSVVKTGNQIMMYYLGWTKGLPEPLFYTSIGLAISNDNGLTFEKISESPILERSVFDPWMVSGGTVTFKDDRWQMLYISGINFKINDGIATSLYDIKYASSFDGIHWERKGIVSLGLKENETNISRPTILLEKGIYKAWYPYKKNDLGYRIGYAESTDGILWNRQDELAGITVSENGWDSYALDKLWVFDHYGKKIMLYNGNQFGIDGIGLAILEE